MRKDLYNKKIETFIQALLNLGWREIQVAGERHFKKNFMHLVLKKARAGYCCVMHIDRFIYGRLHQHSIHESEELIDEFKHIIAEYKRLRS
jgi:hypothetical protein